MATSTISYEPTHPGLTGSVPVSDFHFSPVRGGSGGQDPAGYLPANWFAEMFSKKVLAKLGGGHDYIATDYTVTTTGTSAAAAASTDEGVLLTCGSDSTFNTNLQSKRLWTPVASKIFVACARVIPSDITTVGFEFNVGNSQVDPATTNYTDVIGIKMAVGAGTVIGKVRGDSGTQAVSGTLTTAVAATELFVGLWFSLSATAASVQGGFFAGASANAAVHTAFTAAQQVQAAAILTTPPSMFVNMSAKGSAATPTIRFASAIGTVDL